MAAADPGFFVEISMFMGIGVLLGSFVLQLRYYVLVCVAIFAMLALATVGAFGYEYLLAHPEMLGNLSPVYILLLLLSASSYPRSSSGAGTGQRSPSACVIAASE
jgi:hypothetical protein